MNIAFSAVQATSHAHANSKAAAPVKSASDASRTEYVPSEGERQAQQKHLDALESRMRYFESNLRAAEYQMKNRQEMVSTGWPSRITQMTDQLNSAAPSDVGGIRQHLDALKATLADDTQWLKDNLTEWPAKREALQAQVDQQRQLIESFRAKFQSIA